jgi:hypothetical protein
LEGVTQTRNKGKKIANQHIRFAYEDSDLSDVSDSVDEVPNDHMLLKHCLKQRHKRKQGKGNLNLIGAPKFVCVAEMTKNRKKDIIVGDASCSQQGGPILLRREGGSQAQEVGEEACQ